MKLPGLIVCVLIAGVLLMQPQTATRADDSEGYAPPARIALLDSKQVDESSGLAASRRNPGLFWTHNDGNDGRIFLFDRKGAIAGSWRLPRLPLWDIEDMSLGPCQGRPCLYLGDIGDNRRQREAIAVYRVPEPKPGENLGAVETFRLRYPDGAHDAEALLVHPVTGDVYIVTKARGEDSETLVFKAKAPLRHEGVTTLQRVASLRFPDESAITLILGRVTGGDISPDGRRVILCDYFRGWEYRLSARASFDEIWSTTPVAVPLGDRRQGEGVAYSLDSKAILATSEGLPMPLWEIVRRGHSGE